MNKRPWVIALTVVGLGLSVYGLYRCQGTMGFKEKAQPATASVMYLGHKLRSPDEEIDPWDKAGAYSGDCYRTFVFQTQSGRRVAWQSPFSSVTRIGSDGAFGRNLVPADKPVEILYNPDNPHEFRYATFGGLWAWGIGSLVAGMFLLGLATATELGWPVARRIVEATSLVARIFRRGSLHTGNFRGPVGP